jgi:hypothetical protein
MIRLMIATASVSAGHAIRGRLDANRLSSALNVSDRCEMAHDLIHSSSKIFTMTYVKSNIILQISDMFAVDYLKLFQSKHNSLHMHCLFSLQHVLATCAGHNHAEVAR